MTANAHPPVVVMGVQGSGKSTVGRLLAERLGAAFVDGDELHSEHNKAHMAEGRALGDAERIPWLHTVGETIADGAATGIVVACSALKRSYRDLLRSHAPSLFAVDLEGPVELVAERIARRAHEFMPPELLASQYAALEPLQPDELGIAADIREEPAAIVEHATAALAEAVRP